MRRCFSESNAARVIGQDGMEILMVTLDEWNRIDTKNKHLSLRKAILTCLKHITNLRKSIKTFFYI